MAKTAKQREPRSRNAPRPSASAGGDVIPISQPSPRQSVLWTPNLLKQVSLRADGGDLSLLADLCDQILADDRFGALLGQLADDVLGCELSFEQNLRAIVGSAEKSDDLTTDWARGYDDDELKNIIIWAMVTGIAFAKHEAWVESENGRIVPVLKWWHPQHFGFRAKDNSGTSLTGDLSKHRWHVREPGTGDWTPITPGDGKWVIVTYRSEYCPWRNGLHRGLGIWWLLKQYAIQDSGVHSERAAKTIVTTKEGSTENERRQLSNYIYSAGKDPVIALPEGADLKIVEIEADLDTLYHSQIRLANDSAALTILGQNLSTSVEGGSLAAAKEHSKKESRRVRNAAQMLSKALREQSLTWWAEFNFGNPALAPYPRWHTEPEQDYAMKAASLSTLSTALLTLKTAGWELDEETIEEDYGVVLRKTKALKAREQAEPGDTDGDGIPHNEPGNVNPSNDEADDPTPESKPPKKSPPRPRPRKPNQPAPVTALLASGDDPSEAAGFVRGQIYTDALTDRQVSLIAGELAPFVDRILAAIDGATDYENVRYRIIKAFQKESDPQQMAKLIERALLLADLAGRNAVLEDVPEDEYEASYDTEFADEWDDIEAKYNSGQPRYPKGHPQGGQWRGGKGGASGGGGSAEPPSEHLGAVSENVFGRRLSDREVGDLLGKQAKLPDGLSLSVTRVAEHKDDNTVSVFGAVKNSKGHVVASISREYTRGEDGTTVAKHASFIVSNDHQGSGLGRAVFNAQIDAYKNTKLVKSVTLDAERVGPYVWTKAGFKWSAADKKELLSRTRAELTSQVGAAAASKIMAKVKTPLAVARLTVGDKKVGKDILVNYTTNSGSIVSMSQTPGRIKPL